MTRTCSWVRLPPDTIIRLHTLAKLNNFYLVFPCHPFSRDRRPANMVGLGIPGSAGPLAKGSTLQVSHLWHTLVNIYLLYMHARSGGTTDSSY